MPPKPRFAVEAYYNGKKSKSFTVQTDGQYRTYEIDLANHPEYHGAITGNSLDCTRDNLRICTRAQNCRNRKTQKNSRSKYKVVKIKECKSGYRYRAEIYADNKYYYLGSFKDEYFAMAAYNVMAVKLHREFAYLNTWNGPTIPGQPDPLADELEKIPHRDLVPYPHDPSERLIYIYKFPPHEKNTKNNKIQNRIEPQVATGIRKIIHIRYPKESRRDESI